VTRTRLIRLRFHRRLRRGQKQVEGLGVQAEKHIERHLFGRFGRLKPVRRFLISWIGLMLILIAAVVAQNISLSGYYQQLRTVPGGIYNEGVKGRFTTSDPLFAANDADLTASRLVFAGLFTYDQQGHLTGELARDYVADEHVLTYTVHLKPGLTWHDGQPLTSSDVVFTYRLIQNPDVRSPLEPSWRGIDVSAPDKLTVVFKLPGVLAPFAYNMTNGIVPQHLLAGVAPADLRTADFNTVHPVGAGPFAWQALQVKDDGDPSHYQVRIGLEPFAGYALGKPKLSKFTLQVFASDKQMVAAFEHKQLTAMEGLTEVPRGLKGKANVQQHSLPLRAETMVFFKLSEGKLADTQLRQALVQATDSAAIIKALDYPAQRVREPFLAGQVGYDPSQVQADYNLKAAQQLLDSIGWKSDPTGVRRKDNQPLEIRLTAAETVLRRAAARM